METIGRTPRSPLHLYINLYCIKRQCLDKSVKKDHKLLKEATKSWLSLNDEEKTEFVLKHDRVIAEHKQKIADSLKNVKPYLRKKNQKHFRTDINKNSENLGHNEFDKSFNGSLLERIPQNASTITCANTDVNKMSDISFSESQKFARDGDVNYINQNQLFMQEKLPEPIPPSVMSGKELFLLLGTDAENCSNWESLPDNKKRHYQRAVLTIKRNYITSYKTFLESLEPKELYTYYINNKEME